ncbi:MAG: TonB-dependent receptor [Flavobacteriales bacterium]
MFRSLLLLLLALPVLGHGQCILQGIVQGPQGPVPFAHVSLEGQTWGAAADAQGRFRLEDVPCRSIRIVATAVGFKRTLSTLQSNGKAVIIRMEAEVAELDEVVISGSLREVSRSESPVPIEVVTPKLFRRNPSPALFDAVGMVNGVRPQINCSVCATGDIHINGMEGPYTMVLIDGMPIVSGLSTVYGLSGIPTGLIERVEVVKGPGSALYGSEAMGGIINVITKDPVLAPRITLDAMTTGWQEHSLDAGARFAKGKVAGLFGLNGYWYDAPRDENKDGFTDLTIQKRASLFSKWNVRRPERRVASIAGRYVHEDRWGGQMDWTPAFAGSDSIYGESIATRRWELIGQYQLPLKERVTAQLSWNRHDQRSWYGTLPFNAQQEVLFAQLLWSHRFAMRHHVLAGVAYRQTLYTDDTPITVTAGDGSVTQRRPLPGLFMQDEWSVTETHTLLGGYRIDNDRDHGLVHSPRLAWKYAPSGKLTVRGNFGTGYRVVNLFTEEHAALTGSRTVVVAEDLLPERSWNGTFNVVRRWPGEMRALTLDASAFFTRFGNRILPDYDSDPDLIVYRNLQGHGITRGVSANLEARIGTHWRGMAGATWLQAYIVEQRSNTEQMLTPNWSGTFAIGYERKRFGAVDLTGQWYGPMRLPVQQNDFRPERSPWHALVNVQYRRAIGDRIELYGGVKNLLDFVPRDPIMRPFDPFDRQANDAVANPNGYTFDTSYMYAPMQGQRWFVGLRFTLQ